MQEATAVNTIAQSIAVSVILGSFTALAGCETPPQRDGAAATPVVQSTDSESLEADPLVNDFVAQAQRDVEHLMSLSQRPANDTSPQGTHPRRRSDIQWNIPGLRKPREASIPTPAPPPPPVPVPEPSQGSLAADQSKPTAPMLQPQTNRSTANEPPPDDRLRELMVELSREAYHQATFSDAPLRHLLVIVAQAVLSPDRQLQVDAIPGLTDQERELLSAMQTFYTNLGLELAQSGDPEALPAAVAQLHSNLTKEPQLRLNHAALSSRVSGFGAYDEFKRNEAGRYAFLAHSSQQAVVYMEVEDFTSELNANGEWVTELSQQLVIFSDRDGIPVWRQQWQPVVDVTKIRRRDFYIVQVVTFPEQLSVGRYQLKISVRDEKSKAEAEASLDLEMVADPSLTTARVP